jgi:hypothetical protein
MPRAEKSETSKVKQLMHTLTQMGFVRRLADEAGDDGERAQPPAGDVESERSKVDDSGDFGDLDNSLFGEDLLEEAFSALREDEEQQSIGAAMEAGEESPAVSSLPPPLELTSDEESRQSWNSAFLYPEASDAAPTATAASVSGYRKSITHAQPRQGPASEFESSNNTPPVCSYAAASIAQAHQGEARMTWGMDRPSRQFVLSASGATAASVSKTLRAVWNPYSLVGVKRRSPPAICEAHEEREETDKKRKADSDKKKKADSSRDSISCSSRESANQRQRNLEVSFNQEEPDTSFGIRGNAADLPKPSVEAATFATYQESVNYDRNQEQFELSLFIDKLIDQNVIVSRNQISHEPCRLPFLQREYKVGEAYKCHISNSRETKEVKSDHEGCDGRTFTIHGFLTRKNKEILAIVDEIVDPVNSFMGSQFSRLEEPDENVISVSEEDKKVEVAKSGSEEDKTVGEPWPTWYQANGCDDIAGEKRLILLRLLTKRVDGSPRPRIVYSLNGEGDNFDVQYRHFRPRPCTARAREPPRAPVVLDLFAGAGGMSLGMEDAGFRVEYMVDKKKVCCQTLEDNTDRFHVNGKVFNKDVREFLQCCKDRVPGYPSAADVDHVHASPPCQGFSKANR